jgi:hypothetical protein
MLLFMFDVSPNVLRICADSPALQIATMATPSSATNLFDIAFLTGFPSNPLVPVLRRVLSRQTFVASVDITGPSLC